MNQRNLLAIAALVVAGTPSLRAVPVIGKTIPVGIVKLGDNTVGEPSVQANTDVHISIPLLKASRLTGTVSSISGSVVTISSADSAASLPGPHYLVIGSGSKAGLIALVTASTSTTVTVTTQPGDSLTGITSGDNITLRPAWTLGSLFSSSVPVGTQVMGWTGTAGGINQACDLAAEYYPPDGGWLDLGTFALSNDLVLYPNETLIVRSPSSTSIPFLSIWGEVPTIPSRAYILNTATTGRDNQISYFGGMDEPLLTSAITGVGQSGDMILVRSNSTAGINKSASEIYEFDGIDWIDTVITGNPIDGSVKFEAGKGYWYRRYPTSTMTPTLWSDTQSYLPLN